MSLISDDRAHVARRKEAMREHGTSLPPRPVHCRVCTIIIGKGYEEKRPIPLTNGRGFVCWQCYESIRRQTLRRAAERQVGEDTPVRS
jgi:hypothetical protein